MELNDVKVTLIGDGSVGKTSLVRALSNDKFIHSEVTEGIDIKDIELTADGNSVKIKIWDFGGQEIYHSIHQLFLTKRTIYILVIDARQENNSPYWLNTIQKIVGNVPVIVVINKIDIFPNFNIEQRGLKEKFPGVIEVVRVSCRTKNGIDYLKRLLIITAQSLEFSKMNIPSSWSYIRLQVEGLNREFISNLEFEEICVSNGITSKLMQNNISNYLHDLGIFVHFKNFKLYNTQIINPKWITKAIYTIISSFSNNANSEVISKSEIYTLFQLFKEYPKNKVNFIIDLMEEYELIFRIEETKYILPQLLSVEPPDKSNVSVDSIHVLYKYDFLPKGLFNRILIRTARQMGYSKLWKSGIQLKYLESDVELKNIKYEQSILIEASGEKRKELLFLIREIVKVVNNAYAEIQVEEFIPLNSKKEPTYISHSKLLIYQQKGRDSIVDPEDFSEIKIDKLLEGIDPEEKEKSKLNPIKIFISYSHKDVFYKKEFIKHLSPLIRLDEIKIWEDGELIPGQNWEYEIMTKLEESDIILCLISSDFISSDFCYSIELDNALKAHLRDEKVLIPIFIRACYWKKLPLAQVKGVPKVSISSQVNPDEGWEEVVEGIDQSIDYIRSIR